MAEFLFEIGLEEVPARMVAGAQAELQRRITALLERERLVQSGLTARSFATPRRLAVLVESVAERQEDAFSEILGPSAKVAFKEGTPTAAAVAFAKKAGVEVEALRTISTPKGEYLQAVAQVPGRSASEILQAELPKELAAIPWPKSMYWRPGKPERFVRPVRWLVALLGEEIIPLNFAGKTAANLTYGHRVLYGDSALLIDKPSAYEKTLEKAFVLADVEDRRHRIRKSLDRVCRSAVGARWREDHDLVDTLTHLTEWPTALLGRFEPEFLELPKEVLVTVMRDHQKYFAADDATGKLGPYFLTILNIETDDTQLSVIRHGNERVLRARFNDARFFWEFDSRTPLVERVALLERVTFQRDLGSYAQKSERVRSIAASLGQIAIEGGSTVDLAALDEAARLAKTDLTTELVKEFTELQGIVGGLYARAQGVSAIASAAIYDQYRPEGMEDRVPATIEGALLAIADKADTIYGMFGLGVEPTGSKDPFALRRAANGIVKILAETELPMTLRTIADAAAEGRPELAEKVRSFFAERVEFYLREAKGNAYDVVKAVLAAGFDDVRGASARASAVSSVRTETSDPSSDFAAVSAAFKRMKNILSQAREKNLDVPYAVDASLLLEPAEISLAERSSDLALQTESLRRKGAYREAIQLIAGLRPQVDSFFDSVMVMAPEESVRANRLALLQRVLRDFSRLADFSEIVVSG